MPEEEVKLKKGKIRDVNHKSIMSNIPLCLQYLQDYVDPELFRDVKVEDIEDVTESFHGYLGVTFDPDTVKKVRLAGGKELYLLSLMEHLQRWENSCR